MTRLLWLLLALLLLCGCGLAEDAVLSLGETELTIGVQEKHPLQVTCLRGSSKDIRWSSSAGNVASVKNGAVVGHRPGTADITATITVDGQTCTAVCHVTVLTGVSEIRLSWYTAAMQVGQTKALPEVTLRPSVASVKTVTWQVSDPDVA